MRALIILALAGGACGEGGREGGREKEAIPGHAGFFASTTSARRRQRSHTTLLLPPSLYSADLVRYGFDSPVTLEIQPCGDPPIQPRRRALLGSGCPDKCLMRWKGATADYTTGPAVLPVKKNHRSTVRLVVGGDRPHYIKRVGDYYPGNGGSVQIFAYGGEGSAQGVNEVTVSPPNTAFEGQGAESTLAYEWSKDGAKACEIDLHWEIMAQESQGSGK